MVQRGPKKPSSSRSRTAAPLHEPPLHSSPTGGHHDPDADAEGEIEMDAEVEVDVEAAFLHPSLLVGDGVNGATTDQDAVANSTNDPNAMNQGKIC